MFSGLPVAAPGELMQIDSTLDVLASRSANPRPPRGTPKPASPSCPRHPHHHRQRSKRGHSHQPRHRHHPRVARHLLTGHTNEAARAHRQTRRSSRLGAAAKALRTCCRLGGLLLPDVAVAVFIRATHSVAAARRRGWAVRRLAAATMPCHLLANDRVRLLLSRSVIGSRVRLGLGGEHGPDSTGRVGPHQFTRVSAARKGHPLGRSRSWPGTRSAATTAASCPTRKGSGRCGASAGRGRRGGREASSAGGRSFPDAARGVTLEAPVAPRPPRGSHHVGSFTAGFRVAQPQPNDLISSDSEAGELGDVGASAGSGRSDRRGRRRLGQPTDCGVTA
jgi:hypothetical protein